MRGIALLIIFFTAFPFIFISGPFWGILMWFWVSLMNPQQEVWGNFAGIPYALLVAVATLLAWLLSPREPKAPPLDRTTVLLVLLGFWVTVTSLFGTGPADQIYYKWQIGEKMLLMTIVAYTLTTTRQRLDQVIIVCSLSVAFYGAKGGLFSLRTGGAHQVFGPENSMIGDNNDLGVALTMMLPLLFYLRERYGQLRLGRYGQLRLKWPILILIGLTFLGDVFTYSRGALVALCAVGVMLWWRSRQKVAMGMLIAIAAFGVWSFAPPEWFDRMATIETYQQDASAEGRLYFWKLSWAMALKRPITGGGFQWSFDPVSANQLLRDSGLPPLTKPRAPHSNWFEMLGNHGFVGLAIYLAIIISAAMNTRWLVRHSRKDPELLWANTLGRVAQASLIGYCAGGSFATHGMYDGFYAVVIIIAAARRIVAAELAARAPATARAVPYPQLRPAFKPQPTG
ncbi:MAG TPA: putative O-glycosylation ligase, exosortase A system-associated [Stellaceae bacterium]|nr:putative O-glycosylation ligase, exosortase A system-associated [Stellaceae bacterium]